MEIKNKIRELRFHNNEMSQAKLADLCNVTRQTILAVEAGKYTPSLELAFKIAIALGTNIENVFIYNTEC